jgi:hypothetical protein
MDEIQPEQPATQGVHLSALKSAVDRPTPGLPATWATTSAKTARINGQLGESACWHERGRRVGGAGQESQARGLDASPEPIGSQHSP